MNRARPPARPFLRVVGTADGPDDTMEWNLRAQADSRPRGTGGPGLVMLAGSRTAPSPVVTYLSTLQSDAQRRALSDLELCASMISWGCQGAQHLPWHQIHPHDVAAVRSVLAGILASSDLDALMETVTAVVAEASRLHLCTPAQASDVRDAAHPGRLPTDGAA